jgi:2-(1,2-epoxy-1,2-dihydrophenyl)acetyl-CoA isomerase
MSAHNETAPAATVSREGAVAVLELGCPERKCPWSAAVGTALIAELAAIRDDRSVRAVVLRGADGAFCSGADLAEGLLDGTHDLDLVLMQYYGPVITALRTLPQPVVAAVAGPAVGAGVALALACDLVVAAESATFICGFTRIGVAPDAGTSWLLSSLVGHQRAAELTLLAGPLAAAEAKDWGMVNRVVPDAEVQAEALALATRLAAGPPLALAGAKALLAAAPSITLDRHLELEAETQRRLGPTFDVQEGVSAFLERRRPQFEGR